VQRGRIEALERVAGSAKKSAAPPKIPHRIEGTPGRFEHL
jgi:hypothetical protein